MAWAVTERRVPAGGIPDTSAFRKEDAMKRYGVMTLMAIWAAAILSSCTMCPRPVAVEPPLEIVPAPLVQNYPPPVVLNGNEDLYRPFGRTTQVSRKLARGVGNSLFFWAEIPKNMFRKGYSTYPWAGFWYGLNRGIEQGSVRLGYGLWETLTFFSPGHRNYEPYILPEFVLMDEPDV